jgi:molybdopterin-synthase adenylyltransferase
VNDFAVSRGIPWIYGAAVGSYGLAMPVIPGRTACLRCVYPDPPAGVQPTCETAGVLNVIISAVASIQVADALKILCGCVSQVQPRITTIDLWYGGIRQIDARRAIPIVPLAGGGNFVPGGAAPSAGHPVRTQCRAGPRARAAPSIWRS